MPKIAKKEIKETLLDKSGNLKEETLTSIEIETDHINIIVEKNTFFVEEDEDEEWFKKNQEDKEDESIDIYMLDDDKSW